MVVGAIVITAVACSEGDAGSSARDALHMQYVVKTADCGVSDAVEDPDAPGHCIILGDALFDPSDFTNPVVKHDAALGTGVGITLTSRARDIFARNLETIAPNAQTDTGARLTFAFDGTPLRWTLLPGPDANLFVVTPTNTIAERIAASLRRP